MNKEVKDRIFGIGSAPWLHPFLVALFPILFLYAQNIAETQLSEIFRSIVVSLLLAAVLLVVLRLIFRSLPKAAIMASLSLFLFFSFGHFVQMLGYEPNHWMDLGITYLDPNYFVSILSVLVFLIVLILILRTRSTLVGWTKLINALAALMVVVQVLSAAVADLSRGPGVTSVTDSELSLTLPADPPDVYFIITDAYARHDVLKDIYGFDNSDFLDQLRDWGFLVADHANSNYCQTMLSLPATLNLDFMSNLGTFDDRSMDRKALTTLFQHNRFFRELKKLGYWLVTFKTGFVATNFKRSDEVFAIGLVLNEFENILLNATPTPQLTRKLLPQFAMHRHRIEQIFSGLPEISMKHRPLLVFAHIASPHPPFVFRPDGEAVEADRPFGFSDGSHYFEIGDTREDYIRKYRNQITYVTARLRETIGEILARYPDKKPIIILQSDHGPGSGLDWQSRRNSDLKERFGILNACLLPGIDTTLFYDQITPINTLRLVVDQYFGGHYREVRDQSFFTPWTRPYLYMDITHAVYVPDGP